MKRLLFFISFLFFITSSFAQVTRGITSVDDSMFIHTATPSNIDGAISYLDHPDLNGNSDAKIAVSHRVTEGYNQHVTGVYYNISNQRWGVFNEDYSAMQVNSSYNVYIKGSVANVITHIVTVANQGTSPRYSVLDEPSINGNPNAFLVLTPYYNPHNVLTDHNYGFWYNTTTNRWEIFCEDVSDIPINAAFNVLIQPYETGHTIVFRHEATPASNAYYSNGTLIDHPLLNNKPNASFVLTHYWGAPGYPNSFVVVDHTLNTWYSSSYNKWVIGNEDGSAMEDNAVFNIVVPTATATADISENNLASVSLYPNPVKDILFVKGQDKITLISLHNQLGQLFIESKPGKKEFNIDLSEYATGFYIIKIQTNNKERTYKIYKK
jgi:hypothetical protein